MKRLMIVILLFSSCSLTRQISKDRGTHFNPVMYCPNKISIMAQLCVGDYITGADSGGFYEIGGPNNSTTTIDAQTGCFEGNDLMCGENWMNYIVNNDCDPPCYDTTSVYFFKCCITNTANCME